MWCIYLEAPFISWIDQNVKASVYMTHGYGSDTGWLFQKICINFSTWGYAVFAADLYGHGRSDGLRCYLGTSKHTKPSNIYVLFYYFRVWMIACFLAEFSVFFFVYWHWTKKNHVYKIRMIGIKGIVFSHLDVFFNQCPKIGNFYGDVGFWQITVLAWKLFITR